MNDSRTRGAARPLTRRSLLAIGANLTLLGAVGAFAHTGLAAPARQATPAADAIAHPTGADDLIMRIEVGGGFVPVEVNLTAIPSFSLYGDGRLITTGPQIMIFPPPPLPNLQETRLSEAAIQAVLRAARDGGLLDGDRELMNQGVTDLPTTTITTVAGGKTSVVAAYGLDLPPTEMTPPEDRQALADLAALVAALMDPTTLVPAADQPAATTAYKIEQLQLIVYPIPDEQLDPAAPPLVWPDELNLPLADFGDAAEALGGISPDQPATCGVLSGDEATAVVAILSRPTSSTRWLSDDQVYNVLARPLLPGEVGCPPRLESSATPTA